MNETDVVGDKRLRGKLHEYFFLHHKTQNTNHKLMNKNHHKQHTNKTHTHITKTIHEKWKKKKKRMKIICSIFGILYAFSRHNTNFNSPLFLHIRAPLIS